MLKRQIELSLAGLAVVGAALLAGCNQPPLAEGPTPGVRVRSPEAPYAGVQMDTVVFLDKDLQSWSGAPRSRQGRVAVEQTGARRTPTNTLEVWALLRNRTDYAMALEARSQFFDADLVPVEGPTAWRRLHLPPNGVQTFRDRSTLVDEPAHYYIEVREAR